MYDATVLYVKKKDVPKINLRVWKEKKDEVYV